MSENTTDGNKAEPRHKVGDILRDARIVRDQELKEVAKALAIRLPFMEAIEESRPSDLPGAAYALGFVRSYAGYLGMDSKSLVERYKEEAKELEHETALHFPEPLPSRKVPIGALLFIGIILVLLFYGVWWYLNNQGKNLADIVPALSSEQTEMVQANTQEEPVTIVKETTIAPEDTTSAIDETIAVAEPVVKKVEEVIETVVVPVTDTANQVASETDEITEDTTVVIEEATAEAAEIVEKSEETVAEELPEVSTEITSVVEATNTEVPTTTIEPTETAAAPVVTAPTPTPPTEIVDETTIIAEKVVIEVAEEVAVEAPKVEKKVAEATSTSETTNSTSNNNSTEEAPTVVTPISDERKERIYGEENTGSRVTILAKESAWVEVSDASGELTLTRLLRKGDRYLVPNNAGLTMVTGNAGGIYILVDGNEIGPSGPVGAVRRDYILDADKLLETQTTDNTSNTSN